MMCFKCGEYGELKVFSSFSYYYCNGCKDEIAATEAPKSEPIAKRKGADFDPFMFGGYYLTWNETTLTWDRSNAP